MLRGAQIRRSQAESALPDHIDKWFLIEAVRPTPTHPLVWKQVHIDARYAKAALTVGTSNTPIYRLIKRLYGEKLLTVRQEVGAAPIAKAIAAVIEVKSGSPGLLIERNTGQREEKLRIKPLSEHVGAEISGVNLAADLPNETFEKIDDAYNRYSVLVFRDQKLTPEQQIAFARRFGELEISPRTEFALPGYPEILVLSNIIENGKPIGNADAGRTWHTDMSYTKTPPRGSLLYAREIPIENGRALGDTVFASAAAAFESLPKDKQASLLGLRAIHRGSAKKYAPGSKLGDLVKDIPDVEHPVIRTHPVTGRKAIYVREGECVGICSMPDEQSLPLIKELADMVTRPELCYRHQWRLGDLLMWDNSMTQHLAISDYQLPLRRLMHRVTVNGTVPI